MNKITFSILWGIATVGIGTGLCTFFAMLMISWFGDTQTVQACLVSFGLLTFFVLAKCYAFIVDALFKDEEDR